MLFWKLRRLPSHLPTQVRFSRALRLLCAWPGLQFAFHSSHSVCSTPVTPIFLCFSLSFTSCVCWGNTGNASRLNVTAATLIPSKRPLPQPVFHKTRGSGGARGSPALVVPWAQLEFCPLRRDWGVTHGMLPAMQALYRAPGSSNPAEINILSSPNQELLAFRNFTHPFLLCLVFPFCSHYLFIRITQTPSQTHWNLILGSTSSSSQPTPGSPRVPAMPSGCRTSSSKPRQ